MRGAFPRGADGADVALPIVRYYLASSLQSNLVRGGEDIWLAGVQLAFYALDDVVAEVSPMCTLKRFD